MKRKHISWKTKCASLLLQLGDIPYVDAKQMTVEQIISLYHCDHNILHETEHEDRDAPWNLTHRLIHDHRRKTKQDAKVIAKSRRIRAREYAHLMVAPETEAERFSQKWADYVRSAKPKQKIKSRGFDKTLRKKVNGKVEKR